MMVVKEGERQRFVIHSEKSLGPLRMWLKDRTYNDFYPYLEDARGNRMIGINRHFRNERGLACVTPMGLILLRDEALKECVIDLVEEHKQPKAD